MANIFWNSKKLRNLLQQMGEKDYNFSIFYEKMYRNVNNSCDKSKKSA